MTLTPEGVYFRDPHAPRQRGTSENTNGPLRQYFPKTTDLSVHSREHLDTVAIQPNGQPRKTLDRDTPAERFAKLSTRANRPAVLQRPPESANRVGRLGMHAIAAIIR